MGFCLMILFGSLSASAEADRLPLDIIHRGIAHDALFDIELEGDKGLAVGSFGVVLHSNDGGINWESGKTLGDTTLTAVTMHDEHAITVGQGGAIFISDDSGDSWQKIPSEVEERFLSVDLSEGGRAIIVGGFGTILVSDDWGHNWTQLHPEWETMTSDGYEPHLYDVQRVLRA